MQWNWEIQGTMLALEKSDKTAIYYPSAVEIYAYLYGNQEQLQPQSPTNCDSPAKVFPSLKFSQIGERIKIYIDFDRHLRKIQIQFYVERHNNKIDLIAPVEMLRDHIIFNNEWFFLTDNFSDFIALLNESQITNCGDISLLQYIKLLQNVDRHRNVPVYDEAREMLDNHPIDEDASSLPECLTAKLYPYQKTGFLWMRYIISEKCGCILADEMGLGKTLQIITLIASRNGPSTTPSLIITPVSLLENWKREFAKFTKGLSVLVHHGPLRTGRYTELLDYDAVIISYNTASSDQSLLHMIHWDLLVLDEAQNIKNPEAARTQSVKNIPCNVGIAVTGTPFENHVTDIWSLVDFIAPSTLGTLEIFSDKISDDVSGAKLLEPVLSPLMLRRRVADVANDLPERIDIPQIIQMNEVEALKYENIREQIMQQMGGKQAALPMIQKLRMFCTHPRLLNNELSNDPSESSTKYERLCELLTEIVAMDEKAILFTSFNKMFDILLSDIPRRFMIPVMAINGSTSPAIRQDIVDNYSEISGSALLVLNPRAAGTGLNITAASRIIHYNLEWNPALEDQASARAYRRGQTKKVFVYRLFYKNTVEQIINERIELKRTISDTAIIGTNGENENTDDILSALMLSPTGGKMHE
ncbi:DEAD/DEAH box helicase [Caproiciproducens sp. R2]|uniref:DEAD/DEAH box helicase n=1 Tax=Caproiciproducens sp. R2 TaxID=3435187 RepID=UPI004034126E